MERVAFLIEESGEQLDCLLNPETLVLRRLAGLQPRHAATGALTGRGLSDDPMLFTGGGRTELTLDLLFDVTLAGLSTRVDDVRSLTRPLWDLSENSVTGGNQRRPSRVRFIWGKSWNIPCVVMAVAERLEQFTEGGTPRRSWLRLRLLRVEEERNDRTERRSASASSPTEEQVLAAPQVGAHSIIGGSPTLALPEAVDLLPLPEVEVTISESIVMAAELVADAFTETPAGRMLADVQSAIGDTVRDASAVFEEGVNALVSVIGDSEFVQDLKIAFDAVSIELKIGGGLIGQALASAKTRVVAVTMDAVGAISVAMQKVDANIRQIAREIGAEIDAAIFEPIRAALAPYQPLIDAMMTSAAIVAGAVKARTARMAAVTVRTLEAGAKSAADFLEAVNRGDISIAPEIREAVVPVLEAIKTATASMRESGRALLMEDLPAMMGQINNGVLRLRDAGESALATQLEQVAGTVSLGVDGLRSIVDVQGEVGHINSTERVKESISDIEAVIDESAEDEAVVQQEAILESLTIINNVTIVMQQSEQKAEVDALAEEVAQLKAVIARAAADGEALTAAQKQQIRDGLQKLTALMDNILAHEAESNASAILTAIENAEAEEQNPTDPLPGDVSEIEDDRSLGERLDQLGYRYFGDPASWRLLALYNDIDNPLKLPTGMVLRLPAGDGA